jgi:hypothetical protein
LRGWGAPISGAVCGSVARRKVLMTVAVAASVGAGGVRGVFGRRATKTAVGAGARGAPTLPCAETAATAVLVACEVQEGMALHRCGRPGVGGA